MHAENSVNMFQESVTKFVTHKKTISNEVNKLQELF